MAPKTRANKTGKENVSTTKKSVLKDVKKVSRPPRKPLADKTNSASDDNASIVVSNYVSKKHLKTSKTALQVPEKDRPRRLRRIPNRFVGNVVLADISNSKDNLDRVTKSNRYKKSEIQKSISPITASSKTSFSKTPTKVSDISLVRERPKRVSRLPSRLEEHSISPSKFIPVKPFSASTPIVQKGSKQSKKVDNVPAKVTGKKLRNGTTKILQQTTIESFVNKARPDTNNNPKRTAREKKPLPSKSYKTIYSPVKINTRKTVAKSPLKNNSPAKIQEKNVSLHVLDDRKSAYHENKNDVYEFTFDPTEEPKPQKKKRKRVYKKQPAKPKTLVIKHNYDKNVAQALQALKSKVGKKNNEQSVAQGTKIPVITGITDTRNKPDPQKIPQVLPDKTPFKSSGTVNNETASVTTPNCIQVTNPVKNHVSVRIEDIAAQFEPTPDHHDIDYSPVNSPNRCSLPEQSNKTNDPLNLQPDLSFFDDPPVASSSMNISDRHPTASPWRVEFGNLPIKWNVNTYVKPNMTPAYECSYIDNDTNNKKKHIYTNILPRSNKSIPDAETISTQLKQTSIISFIKEVVNRSVNKKKKKNAVTPTKQNSLFEDSIHNSIHQSNIGEVTPDKSDGSNHQTDGENAENSSESNNAEQSNAEQTRKRKNPDPIETVAKTARKDNDLTLFGFDESENYDQENVPPVKIDKTKKRNLRPRAGAVLKEINAMSGPTRAVVPAKAKLAMNSEVVNKIYEEIKSAETAPAFPEKETQNAPEVTNIGAFEDNDSQSVHLFEDIELVHHLKPTRKSYGKARKVTFRQNSTDSESSKDSVGADQDSYDDLADLSFEIPVVKAKKTGKKKLTKKQKISKKQEQEVDEWAAQFNSMCEEVDNVDLIVE